MSDTPRLKWTQGGMVTDNQGGYIFAVDYDALERQLAAAHEAERIATENARRWRREREKLLESLRDIADTIPTTLHGNSQWMRRHAIQAIAAVENADVLARGRSATPTNPQLQ